MSKSVKLTLVPDGMTALEALKSSLGELTGAELYKKIVERVGREPGLELGHGMKGVVYGLGGDRVLKITADASELQAMSLMKGANHPNLVHVDSVFIVCRGQSGVGVVVREWVGNVLEKIDSMGNLNDRIRRAVDDAEERFEGYRREGNRSAQAIAMATEDLLNYLESVGDGNEGTLKVERGIRAGVRKLMSMGVYGIDFDPRNIAIDDSGNAVIFDVGVVEVSVPTAIDKVGCLPGHLRIVSPV